MGDVKSYGSDCFFVDQWYARHKSGTPDVQGRTMLSERAREFPEFPAALAFMLVLPPDEVRAALEERLSFLRARLSELEADLTEGGRFLPRVFLVESEYQRAVLGAELDHVRGLVDDLLRTTAYDVLRISRGRPVEGGGRLVR
ncbi:hypothetical protein [Streptosporangium sp. NPDC049304]|uniref:hypothetical protein n=1 Tax=Streptosporangium sp. NPDC049304 TaxID=3154830 RepID=UPI0034400F95